MKRIGYWRQRMNSGENLPWPEEGRLPYSTKQKIENKLLEMIPKYV